MNSSSQSRIQQLYEMSKKMVAQWKQKQEAKASKPCHHLRSHHGLDGHTVNQVLDEVHQHFDNVIQKPHLNHTPHLVFSLSPSQLEILEDSERYDALKSLMGITHKIIEAEVEEVLGADKKHMVKFSL